MFMLYALVLGLVVGLFTGGNLGRLAAISLSWAWVAVAGLAAQLVLFSAPVTAVVGDAGPLLYIASTAVVLLVVVRNARRYPFLALVALGAACNLAAIVANGGFMPALPDALAAADRLGTSGYSNSIANAHPALELLVDRFVLPAWLIRANVFSAGDALIGLGIAGLVAIQMRRPSTDAGPPARARGTPARADG